MSWEALAISFEVCSSVRSIWESEQHIELLWSGPSPANCVPARRIDQVLYDLVSGSRADILLITFAAYKVKLLMEALISASRRNVSVRLVLEFEETSLNQLSMDALKALARAASSASAISIPSERTVSSSRGRPAMRCFNVAPSRNSIAMNACPSCSPTL